MSQAPKFERRQLSLSHHTWRLALILTIAGLTGATTGHMYGAEWSGLVTDESPVFTGGAVVPVSWQSPTAPTHLKLSDQPCGVGAEPTLVPSEAGADHDQTWVGLEYLLWWSDGRYLPPLVTTNPHAGVLPAATVLYGGGTLAENPRSGGRLEVGHWLAPDHCVAIGGRFVAVGNAPLSYSLTSAEQPFFARPFVDAATGTPNAMVIASNAVTTGNLNLRADSEFLASDVFLRWCLKQCGRVRLDLISGYQFAHLNEGLDVSTFTQVQPTGLPSISVRDSFATKNEYHGLHVGLAGQYQLGCWNLQLSTRSGFGDMHEVVTIDGATTTVDSTGDAYVRQSGLLAQLATNAGVHSRDEFSFMEDVGIRLGYTLRERWRLSLGYSLMYWSRVVRPGDQIDTLVDSRLFAGATPNVSPAHPSFTFQPVGFFVQGLNAGLECAF